MNLEEISFSDREGLIAIGMLLGLNPIAELKHQKMKLSAYQKRALIELICEIVFLDQEEKIAKYHAEMIEFLKKLNEGNCAMQIKRDLDIILSNKNQKS